MADIQNGTITIKGIDELEKKLTQMRTEDPTFEKRLRGAIREILKEARKELSGDAKENLQMQSDPRQAYKAVKSAVYRRILGGNVSILSKRKAGRRGPVPPVYHKLEHEVNSKGNHRYRNMWSATRWQTYNIMSAQVGSDGMRKSNINKPTDLIEFPWERETVHVNVSQEDIDEMQALMDSMNAQNTQAPATT